MSTGGSTPSTQTVYQQQTIPQYQQDYAIENENVARGIAARPYSPYGGQRIANFNEAQGRGFEQISQAATGAPLTGVYHDTIGMLSARANDAYGGGPMSADQLEGGYSAVNQRLGNQNSFGMNPLSPGQIEGDYNNINQLLSSRANNSFGVNPLSADQIEGDYSTVNQLLANRANNNYDERAGTQSYGEAMAPGAIAPWMSPYVDQALQPQINDIMRRSQGNALNINAGASSAGAFGDARTGVQQGENDRNTAQLISDVTGTGYSNAYDRAVSSSQGAFGQNSGQFNAEQAAQLAAFGANAGQFNSDRTGQLQALDRQSGNIGAAQGAGLQSFAAGAGQFNADRTGQLQALGQQSSNIGSAQGAGLQSFGASAGQFNSDQARQLQALGQQSQNIGAYQGAGLQSFDAGAGQYNAEMARQLQALGMMPSAADSEYGYQSRAANDLLGIGKTQQEATQGEITTAYQDYINQTQYPQEMLNLRLATQQGSPYNTTRMTQTPYSPGAQNLGALASLVGLFGGMK